MSPVGELHSEGRPRPAFEFFEGFSVTAVLASLEIAGLLDDLEAGGIEAPTDDGDATEHGILLGATLEYLVRRGVLHLGAGTFVLTELGRDLCRDKGYLVWLAGGYGEPLRHLGAFLRGDERYGTDVTRDGRWVAKGAALLGGRDVAPEAMRLLKTISFDRVLDLGCGNARFLTTVCREFDCDGAGVDISPEACEEARRAVRDSALDQRVQIVHGDAVNLDAIPLLRNTELVITFFLLHEISSQSRRALTEFLSRLASLLPHGAYLLIAEVVPALPLDPAGERFTPEFTFMHSMMRQSLLPAETWREALQEGGFPVKQLLRLDMPGGLLILAQRAGP